MHWFLNPIQNHYADFTGRATRQEYWMFCLCSLVLFVGLEIVAQKIAVVELISTLISLAILLPSLAIAARRLHDVNMSGWWQLLVLIPVLGFIILLFFTIKQGDEGENQYGSDPRAPEASAAPETAEEAVADMMETPTAAEVVDDMMENPERAKASDMENEG